MTEETSRQINNGPGDSNDLMLIFLTWKLEMDFKIPVVSTKKCLKQTGLLIHDGMERYWNI